MVAVKIHAIIMKVGITAPVQLAIDSWMTTDIAKVHLYVFSNTHSYLIFFFFLPF